MHAWLDKILACPIDHQKLVEGNGLLVCQAGHEYHFIEGIPVLLEGSQGVVEEYKKNAVAYEKAAGEEVDPYVREMFINFWTLGNKKKKKFLRLTHYPIPELEIPSGNGYFLDIGCNWGRWCISAERKGYAVVGIDRNIDAVLAACRVAKEIGSDAAYVIADAARPPFMDRSFDAVFSYNTVQYMSKDKFRRLKECLSAILKEDALCLIQFANTFGARNLYHQCMRFFGPPRGQHDEYYQTALAMKKEFAAFIGPVSLFADGFFCLNPHACDAPFLPFADKVTISISSALKKLSKFIPFLKYFADSLYVESIRRTQ